jgi:hypothetical protein
MMLLPNVPDFCPSHRHATKIHQRVAAGCAFLEKEEDNRTKGWTVPLDSTRRHINPPCGIVQKEVFFRDLSRKREISEQFVWLNRQYGETEAQLSRSAITPSIRADSSQDEGI